MTWVLLVAAVALVVILGSGGGRSHHTRLHGPPQVPWEDEVE